MIDQLHIQLLGAFQICFNGRSIQEADWTLRKAQHLIKLLALAPHHRLHREQLMESLWPDVGPEAAINSLRRTLYVARQTISSTDHHALLRTQNGWVNLVTDATVSVDVTAFLAAATTAQQSKALSAYYAALSLYTGELLPSDPYEEWVTIPRTTIETTYMNLLWGVVHGCEEQQDWDGTVTALNQLLEKDPTSEDAHVWLMQVYSRLGQRYQALRQFDILQAVLQREFDLEPSDTAQRLLADIRSGNLPPPAIVPAGTRGIAEKKLITNLPHDVSSFIGRTATIPELSALVRTSRIVTLVGIGGMGKTRLALSVGQSLLPMMPDGVCFIELAELHDAQLLPTIVATQCGLSLQSDRPVMTSLIAHLQEQELLLIIDNCEHLLAACGDLVSHLARHLPQLRVLCTSRIPLGIVGETIWRVPPLAVPDRRLPYSLQEMLACESIVLFSARARTANPQFILNEHTAPFVAHICQQLDGIPLAIELVAAWVDTLDIQELAGRLGSRMHMASQATLQPEGKTLEAMISWTVETLTHGEQQIFIRLAVFAQGWTLEAAENICSDSGTPADLVLNGLATLVRKSLVFVEQAAPGGMRYRLLEPIRQYALRMLAQRDEVGLVQRRHATYYEALVQAAQNPARIGIQLEWLNRFDTELFNIRAALSWALACPDKGCALRLCGGLWYYWYARAYFAEGLRWLEAVLPPAADCAPQDIAAAWRGYAIIHHQLGHYATARSALEQSRDYLQEINDQQGLARIYSNLGMVLIHMGQLAAAREALDQSLELEQNFSPLRQRLLAATTHRRGELEVYCGRYADAKDNFRRALAVYRTTEINVSACDALHWLGEVCLLLEEYDEARVHLEESLVLAQRHNYPQHSGICLIKLGMLELEVGAPEVAEAAYAEAGRQFQHIQMEQRMPWVTYGLGMVGLTQRNWEQAASHLNQAQQQFTANNDVLFMVRCHLAQSIVAAMTGQQADALVHLQKVEPLIQDFPALLLGVAEVMAVLCLGKERWVDAVQLDALVDSARREWQIPRLPSGQRWYEPVMQPIRHQHPSAYLRHTVTSYAALADHCLTLLEEFKEGVSYGNDCLENH